RLEQTRHQVGRERAGHGSAGELEGERVALSGADPDREDTVAALLPEQNDAQLTTAQARRLLLNLIDQYADDHVLEGHLDHGWSLPSRRSETGQAVAQAGACPVQPDTDRSGRLPEERGYLLARQPIHVVQKHGPALLRRQPG